MMYDCVKIIERELARIVLCFTKNKKIMEIM